ncbi:hypothetical protein [Streptomyces sp. NPDC051572]|uniref:hypothetical protein n=1 Tax=Streptomyces sp. NPDC051572 TaxID=3155802 RepID=UPI00344FD2AC
MTPTARHTPALLADLEGALPATADRWLWQLVSRFTPEDFPRPPETAGKQLKDVES